ncbi:ABC transporter substrate-binding protein [Helicobacter sp. 12S02232-10]|uniref:extracellular solute-binding protein n=1 Tax=Helicobacter sp. 12S02232-10 TaxID=1476197 RepID=UPI000BA54059|nr:extracellular solute-binding protein [Helicobacter sp. 12S02232-10]PAF49986.1 ABC transporter substrate-binding protein [Helicobacter sp. 12S02232-10]
MRIFKTIVIFLLTGIFAFGSSYISLGEKAKYPHLKHFDYVNPLAPKGGSIKNYSLGTFDSLNPFIIKGTPADGLELVYDTLLVQSLDEPYAEYALIADDIEVAKDNSFVIFHIDKRAKFSDGKSVEASDVKFSFDILMQQGSPVFKQYYADIKEAVVLDKNRIKFIFRTNKNRELPLILGQLQILPKHYYEKNPFGKNPLLLPVGSGPYKVKSFDVGKKIVYERDKNYWAKDLPSRVGQFNFDTSVYEYYKDDTVALRAFLSGAYDWRIETSAKVWARGYTGKALSSGEIKKISLRHYLPSGMQGFFFNTRRNIFKDIRVREALFYAFDFEWSNKNLFFSQYKRTSSYFNNSVFASFGVPKGRELDILKQYQKELKTSAPKIFSTPYVIPSTDGDKVVGENRRENLKYAQKLLEEAGWKVKNNRLINVKTGKPFVFTLLLDNLAFERLALAYAQNLKVLGIEMKIQRVDLSQYINRLRDFDYDMIVAVIGQSLFPGNEQRYFWGSQSAKTFGSKNYAGVSDPVVDDLIKLLIKAKDRSEQIELTRALDRVLLWGFYVIPHFYLPDFRIAYWNKIQMPSVSPKYGFSQYLWWDKNLQNQPKEP